jgi:hypothetical protein
MKNFFLKLNFILAFLAIFSYLSIVFYAPMHILEMSEMHAPMEHCPFMDSNNTLCRMSSLQHLQTWKDWLLAYTNNLFFIIFNFATTFTFLFFVIVSISILRQLFYLKRQRIKLSNSFLAFLFATGKLNSKLFSL